MRLETLMLADNAVADRLAAEADRLGDEREGTAAVRGPSERTARSSKVQARGAS